MFKTSYFAFYGIVYCIVVNNSYFCIVKLKEGVQAINCYQSKTTI